ALGDLRRLVADALKVDHRLGDADDQTQVGGRRLTPGKDAQAFLVDVALHLVDLVIDLAYLPGQTGVSLDKRGHRVVDLLLDQPAHGQQVAAHLLQLGVELLRDVVGEAVFVDHGRALANPDEILIEACRARRRRAVPFAIRSLQAFPASLQVTVQLVRQTAPTTPGATSHGPDQP